MMDDLFAQHLQHNGNCHGGGEVGGKGSRVGQGPGKELRWPERKVETPIERRAVSGVRAKGAESSRLE